MSEENSKPKKLSLSGSGKLTLGGGALDQTALRGGVGAGRGKSVQVEVRRKRVLNPALRAAPSAQPDTTNPPEDAVETPATVAPADDRLTATERANRIKVLQEGLSKTKSKTAEDSLAKENKVDEKLLIQVDTREARRRAELAELEEIEKQAAAIRQNRNGKAGS